VRAVDYILIDSRTGISDTSGICTVQMPDDLVVCYTLNRQSVRGAAAVARSAFEQRRKPDTQPGLRVWPLATRIELAEKDRLEEARQIARGEFEMFVMHLPRKEREYYWGRAEILYQPYFAYEEVLAVFADKRHQTNSMLAAFESMVSYFTDGEVMQLGPLPDDQRQEILRQYVPERPQTPAAPPAGKVFINYFSGDVDLVYQLVNDLQSLGPDVVLWDRNLLRLGDKIESVLSRARESATIFLAVYGSFRKQAPPEALSNRELTEILNSGKPIIPIIVGDATWSDVPSELRAYSGIDLGSEHFYPNMEVLQTELAHLLKQSAPPTVKQVDDPQKGQWGGKSFRNGKTLTAKVEPISDDWFSVMLRVQGASLSDPVTFYLHPSFTPSEQTVQPSGGSAVLQIQAWGAFTVGAVADSGRTVMELDLAELGDAPQKFRER
jgi:hypothetical protein